MTNTLRTCSRSTAPPPFAVGRCSKSSFTLCKLGNSSCITLPTAIHGLVRFLCSVRPQLTVARNDFEQVLIKSPLVFTFGLLFSLVACNNPNTPAETTLNFWAAIADKNLDSAKKYCSSEYQTLQITDNKPLKNSAFKVGKIIIEDQQATVETLVTVETENPTPSFTTFLLQEKNHWKIDCKRSIDNFSADPFNKFFNNLNQLGESINKKMEQQLPLFEKKIESIGQELNRQLDNFENELKKSAPQKQKNPYQNTI